MADETGQRVGDYEVMALLGSGGMGRVYKVRSVISHREEAMKILLPDFAAQPELAARFMAEIRTLAGLDHPNITQLRTAIQIQNQFVMVMEYVEGTTLDKMPTRLSLDQAIDYSLQVLAALSYAHGKGVTHRDIKPANIMITSHGVVKLMDFGIAKSTDDLNLTRPGTTMGSIYYMSPEQVRGGAVDPRSDIYSFGVTLYEMITGRKPFDAETSYSVLNAQLNEAPAPPVQWNPALSPELNDIVLRAMAKDPGARFQTAEEFRNALKSLQEFKHAATAGAVAAAAAVPAAVPGAVPFSASGPVAVPPPNAAPNPNAGFAPVPVAVMPPQPKSHRGLWIGLGALAAVLALVAVAAVLPHFLLTHAGQKPNSASNLGSSAPSRLDSITPPPNAPTPQQSTPMPTAAAEAPQGNDVVLMPSKPSGQNNGGSPHVAPAKNGKEMSLLSGTGKAPAQPLPHPVNPQQPQPQQVAPPVQPPTPAGPSPDEVRHSRDRYMDLDARAESVSSQVEQMRRQQQAQGYDLRGDMVAALNRMNNDLREADRSIQERDLAAARDYMDKANEEMRKLEGFLGR